MITTQGISLKIPTQSEAQFIHQSIQYLVLFFARAMGLENECKRVCMCENRGEMSWVDAVGTHGGR